LKTLDLASWYHGQFVTSGPDGPVRSLAYGRGNTCHRLGIN
jgi:hypothetical protein